MVKILLISYVKYCVSSSTALSAPAAIMDTNVQKRIVKGPKVRVDDSLLSFQLVPPFEHRWVYIYIYTYVYVYIAQKQK